MSDKIIVIFGAGKIGRSFIGQLFGLSGYEVVFVDIDQKMVDELNRRNCYPVVIKGEKDETILVPNVRAVSGANHDAVIQEISRASLLAVSVGKNALGKIIPLIAEGLKVRNKRTPGNPLDIIIAENMRSAGRFMHDRLYEALPESYPLDKLVGLVETSIGKMVPIMTEEDMKEDYLMVFAEPYNDLIVDKQGFKGPLPQVKGLSPKNNIEAWVDRKAFIHNMGHATVAYLGCFFCPEAKFIYEVLGDTAIFSFTRRTMLQASGILLKYYPDDFSFNDLKLHVDDLLSRFQNKALKDTVFRVGQDLPRKLGIHDRFAGIIQMAKKKGIEYDLILKAMAFGFFFNKTDDHGSPNPQDEMFANHLKEEGINKTLISLCGFSPEKDQAFIGELKLQYLNLKQIKKEDKESLKKRILK
jgi:mannitol-1-phosphate 5-dehydrogenase